MPRERHSKTGLMRTFGASIDPALEERLIQIARDTKRSKAQIGGFLLARGYAAWQRDGRLDESADTPSPEPPQPDLPLKAKTASAGRLSDPTSSHQKRGRKSQQVRKDIARAAEHIQRLRQKKRHED